MEESEILNLCNDYFNLGSSGLEYKIWRKGLKKDCVGQRVGNNHSSGYCFVKIKGKLYAEHRLVWLMHHGSFPVSELDHEDLDKRNNAIGNLRESTRSGNCSNRNGWGSSGYKGVTSNKRGKPWLAYIRKDGKVTRLGNFEDIEETAKAYDIAAMNLHGVYALTNFPKENYL